MYDYWSAKDNSGLIGLTDQFDTFELIDGNYNAHFELRTINDQQHFFGLVSTIAEDGELTDFAITSATIDAQDLEASYNFEIYLDGSARSGVTELSDFDLSITKLQRHAVEIDGTSKTM